MVDSDCVLDHRTRERHAADQQRLKEVSILTVDGGAGWDRDGWWRMVSGLKPWVLAGLAWLAAFAFVPSAHAVTSGPWKGGDIEFRVSDNRIGKVSVVAVHTCQAVGTGEFFNEVQRFTPPGRFRIGRRGRFVASRYVNRANDYFDIRFAWKGRIRGSRMSARAQTSYKYYAYYGDDGYRLTSCYSERIFRAKPKR